VLMSSIFAGQDDKVTAPGAPKSSSAPTSRLEESGCVRVSALLPCLTEPVGALGSVPSH
jgi:hypothetical protein